MQFCDRVRDTTVTTGSSVGFTLADTPPTQHVSFASRYATSSRVPYACVHQSTSTDEWEVGWGTMGSTALLNRTQIYASSNGGAAVDFSSGTKDIFVSFVADFASDLSRKGLILVGSQSLP
jgi:hypothetical protein